MKSLCSSSPDPPAASPSDNYYTNHDRHKMGLPSRELAPTLFNGRFCPISPVLRRLPHISDIRSSYESACRVAACVIRIGDGRTGVRPQPSRSGEKHVLDSARYRGSVRWHGDHQLRVRRNLIDSAARNLSRWRLPPWAATAVAGGVLSSLARCPSRSLPRARRGALASAGRPSEEIASWRVLPSF